MCDASSFQAVSLVHHRVIHLRAYITHMPTADVYWHWWEFLSDYHISQMGVFPFEVIRNCLMFVKWKY